jgi:hypothetical protein
VSAEWVRTFENDGDYIESLGGVMWNDARLPLPWHRCRTRTRGRFGPDYVERCPCGAARMSPGGPWVERNETRKARARARREARLPRVQVTCGECGKPYEATVGTRRADQRLCDSCWGEAFVASGGKRFW